MVGLMRFFLLICWRLMIEGVFLRFIFSSGSGFLSVLIWSGL